MTALTAHLPITALTVADLDAELDGLAELLAACVAGGASVNFVEPFGLGDARRFWIEQVRPGVAAGSLSVLVAHADSRIAGTVHLDCATPPNQPHRADVRKLLIHPDFRRRGLARALMAAVETRATALDRRLLTLDTRSGDDAEALYVALGYIALGRIPSYSRAVDADRLDDCTFFYKQLPG